MTRSFLCFFVTLFLAASAIECQQPAAPAVTQAVLAGKLIDVRTGAVRPRAYILIAGDRVQSIADSAPAGVPVTDLSAYTVLPGLIDAHAHTPLQPHNAELRRPSAHIHSASHRLGRLQPAPLAGSRLHLGARCLRGAAATIRSSRCATPSSAASSSVRASPPPAVASRSPAATVTARPSRPTSSFRAAQNVADTVDDIARVVRRDIKYGADWIKLMATGGVMDPISDFHVQELSEAQMAAAVEIAHRAGKKVMAHAEGAVGIKAAVRAGVDSIEHGTMLDEEGAQLMEQHHTWLVPTLYCFQHDMETGLSKGRDPDSYAKGVEIMAAQGPAFKLALAHHIRIVYGVDDADVDESVSKEFGALVRGGMSPLGALQAATINAATMLDKDKDVGTLEPGRYADIVAVQGDPLSDITVMEHVAFVMQGGHIIKDPAHPDRNPVIHIK